MSNKPASQLKPNAHKVFTFCAILASLLIVIAMFTKIWQHLPGFGGALLSARQIQAQIDETDRQIAEKTANLAYPGPEPDWLWHPYEHYMKWQPKNEIYQAACKQIDGLKNHRQSLTDLLNSNPWIITKGITRFVWFDLVRPLFELLLLLAAFSFGLRIYLRYLLMRGKFGVVRI